MKRPAIVVAFVCLGCGDGSAGGGDATGPIADGAAGMPDATAVTPDAEVPATCRNGTTESWEACDDGVRSCADLGGTWSSGDAPCRFDCAGWDPSACTLAQPGAFEAVKPAERDDRWAAARCNDGSPFAFVVRMASEPTDDWLIYLEGGVMCDDDAFPCAGRDPYLTSTLPSPDRGLGPIPFGGLFSSNAATNPLAGANQVLAHYCSSDFWSGVTEVRRPNSADVTGWYFSGKRSVVAMIGILRRDYGLAGDRGRILFAGGSAGAFGAHFNIEWLEEVYDDAAREGRLMLLVDAGVMHAWDHPDHRLGAAAASDAEVWRAARDFWGGQFDVWCEEEFLDEESSCLFGDVWYPRVSSRVPVFIQQSTQDASFTQVHGLSAGDPDMATWRGEVEAVLAPMAWVFTSAGSYHVLGGDDAGVATGPAGSTFGEALGRFWDGGAPERVEF